MNTIYNITNTRRFRLYAIIAFILLSFSSCEELLEVDPPIGQINTEEIFTNEQTAEAAVSTLYAKLRDDVLLAGRPYGQGVLMGLYADELDYYAPPGEPIEAFYNHQIIASNDVVKTVWSSTYQLIYRSNAILEGLMSAPGLSEETKNRLTGEALFIRSLCFFYLTNLFGDIPLVTTTHYEINRTISRTARQEVYLFIVEDLLRAKSLLPENYSTELRSRANKYAASALLGRTYLYLQDWEKAIAESSYIIHQNTLFEMSDAETAFLKDSKETILQLQSKNQGDNTHEAVTFQITAPPSLYALSPGLVNSFEDSDLRKVHWIKQVSDGANNWYGPKKYSYTENTGNSMEYSIVFRLAEQYLIRSEAYAQSGNISGSLSDINIVRSRAGLIPLNISVQQELMDHILQERRHEFFAEHGHRWFDLKRFAKANEIMQPLKPNWRPTDVLLPVPETELLLNPHLAPQNAGY